MKSKRQKRQLFWSITGGWLVLIYSTLYIARPICEYLKKVTPFTSVTNVLIIIILPAIIIGAIYTLSIREPRTYVYLLIIMIFYIIGFVNIQYPEEKIHFIEYGILAFLIFRSLNLDIKEILAYLVAFLLTSLFGWIDEAIQHILPNRYYQNEDVLLNSISGMLGLALTFTLRREINRENA